MGPRDYRIYEHPIIDFRRGRKITFYYDDMVVEAYEGECILAALYAIGVRVFSWTPKMIGIGLQKRHFEGEILRPRPALGRFMP